MAGNRNAVLASSKIRHFSWKNCARQSEEALHERRVLVVVRPDPVDVGALERLRWVGEEQLEPARVVARGVEVEALVAREAEVARGGEQPHGVDGADQGADGVIGATYRGRKLQLRTEHGDGAYQRAPAFAMISFARRVQRSSCGSPTTTSTSACVRVTLHALAANAVSSVPSARDALASSS